VLNRLKSIQFTATKALIGINVLVFVFKEMLDRRGRIIVDDLFGLSGEGLVSGMVWQPVTYQFVHAGLFHLVVNMIGLWFAGNILERILGVRRFVQLFLVAGIAGGFLQMIYDSNTVLVGASGSVCGLIAAFSTLYPRMPITVLLFFVIPVRMQAMWLGISVVILSALLLISGLFGNIGNLAHIGGAVAGFAWVRFSRHTGRIY
jgi:membrane associated rhomboid family serine protease